MWEAIGLSELADDPRFARNRERVEHREELTAALAARFGERPADEWVEALQAAGVPVDARAANLDERAVEASAPRNSPSGVAALLASEKARLHALGTTTTFSAGRFAQSRISCREYSDTVTMHRARRAAGLTIRS